MAKDDPKSLTCAGTRKLDYPVLVRWSGLASECSWLSNQPGLGRRPIVLDTSLARWYDGMVLNHLHIGTKMVGTFLKEAERKKLIDDFNDPKSNLTILIVMCSGSAQYDLRPHTITKSCYRSSV